MTLIENDSPKVQYAGPFIKGQLLPLTFPYIEKINVHMLIDGKAAEINKDFEIDTKAASARIKNDLPNAKQITLYRATPLDQQAPFPQISKFRSERVEQALDKLTMQQQEQEEQLSRCIIAPITLETFNGQLPEPAADQALKWNTDGTELENYDIIGEQEAFEEAVTTQLEEQYNTIENRIGEFEGAVTTQLAEQYTAIDNRVEEFEDAVTTQLEEQYNTIDNRVGKFEGAVTTQLEEQYAAIENRMGEFEEATNTQFSDFRNEITENLDAVLDAAGKLEVLDQQVQVAENAASQASAAAARADEAVNEAESAADQAEEALTEVREFIQTAEDRYLNKDQITNCLLEVPQNIKVELTDGTLTLKAGSKVIMPNGFEADGTTPKFDEIVTTQDLSIGATSLGSTKRFLALIDGKLQLGVWERFTSGTTPTSTDYYYHTSENKMYANGQVANLSFPFLFGDYVQTTGFTSIDQVFNGMGYIGSTIWVDKGVKLLFPNGRNEDGSLNNIEGSTQVVKLFTIPNNYTNPSAQFVIDSTNGIKPNTTGVGCNGYIEVDEIPTLLVPNNAWLLHRPSNLVYQWNNTTSKYASKLSSLVAVADVSISTGVITSFQPKQVFRAVDYKDIYTKTESDTRYVNTTGDTMTGALHIKNTVPFVGLINSDFDKTSTGTLSSNQTLGYLRWRDKNNVDISALAGTYMANGNIQSTWNISRIVDGTNKIVSLTIGVTPTGAVYTYAPTPAAGDNTTKIATTAFVNTLALPIGMPQLALNSTLPTNCVWLEGSTVSRTTYANLFAIYGTTYGAGDGSTTFVLPDFRNRAIWGSNGFGYLSAGLPNITGTANSVVTGNGAKATGAFTYSANTANVNQAGSVDWFDCYHISINASRSSSIYGSSSTVQPPAIKVRVYARYK